MANISSWQSNFIQRCEYVGWRVERTKSNHYKVYDGTGKFIFTFPTTPGDKRSMMNSLADAKRCGLEDLENRAKLRDERDRLERLERDRETAENEIAASDARAISEIAAAPADASASVASQPDLGQVNGIAIAAVAPAQFKTSVMAEFRPFPDAEELLLADGSLVYRCVKPAATMHRPDARGLCHKTYETVNSLVAHMRYHSRPKSKLNETGREAAVSATPSQIAESNGHRPEIATLDHALAQAQLSVERIADNLKSLVIEFGSIRDAVRKLPVADAEILDKAAQFDALGAIFKQAAGR